VVSSDIVLVERPYYVVEAIQLPGAIDPSQVVFTFIWSKWPCITHCTNDDDDKRQHAGICHTLHTSPPQGLSQVATIPNVESFCVELKRSFPALFPVPCIY
jgi:hypothetical protein